MKRTKENIRESNRSGKTPCEICGDTEVILQTHHIRGRKIPDPEHASNLVNLCPNCHSDVHWGKVIIEQWAMTTDGLKLLWHKEGEESFTGNDALVHLFKDS